MTHTEYMREWRKKNPESANRAACKWRIKSKARARYSAAVRAKYPLKKRAWNIVSKSVQSGAIVKPTNCQDCHKQCIPQAHHEDYKQPKQIIWLCRPCHLKREGKTARVHIKGDPKP